MLIVINLLIKEEYQVEDYKIVEAILSENNYKLKFFNQFLEWKLIIKIKLLKWKIWILNNKLNVNNIIEILYIIKILNINNIIELIFIIIKLR